MVAKKVIPYEMLLVASQQMLEIIEEGIPREELVCMRYFLDALNTTLKDCIEKANSGWPIIAYNFAFPRELLYFFDVVPIITEGVSFILSAFLSDGTEPYFDLMANYGHPHHTCNAQKGTMGLTLDGLFQFDVVTTPTSPCDNAMGSFPAFKYLQGKKPPKVKVLDMPIYRDDRSREYFAQELIAFRDEVGEILGQKPNEEKFRRAVENESKSIELIREINELKKAKPSPLESMMVTLNSGSQLFLSAREEKIKFLKHVLEHAKKNYKQGTKPSGEEKFRAVCPNMTLFFNPGYLEYLDKKKGVSVLFDIFSYIFYDPIDPNQEIDALMKGLASQCMQYPMTRQSQGFAYQLVEDMIFLASDYDADFLLFTNHHSCKNLQPIIPLLREAAKDELGIPLCVVDVDVGDRRYTSLETLKEKVNIFLDTLF
jgi:benzoyl-CoA reductase/2-hydroxyglutaryl-CoA dehydratase subunit BcrC/BadD/HgdB